jgi:hypothetical protein
MPKSSNRCYRFWGPNRETRSHRFWDQTGINRQPLFWGQTKKPDLAVLRPNHWQTLKLGFEAKPRKSRSSSPYARCRLHTVSPDLSIILPPSTWLVIDHLRCSASGLLLPSWSSSLPIMPHISPTHHETSKHDSPHKIDSRTTEISRIRILT